MKIIYATTNDGKRKQVEEFFKAMNINELEFITLNDIGFYEEIEETGTTLEENSMIKAKAVKEFCDLNNIKEIIVADDTGLCVDCLNGEPGVRSARYADKDGHHGSQQEILDKLLRNIEQTGDTKRKAKMVCVLTAIFLNGEIKQVRGECGGKIAKEPKTMGKLTYGPVFIPEGSDKVMNDMAPVELGTTHREKAFLELLKYINKNTNIILASASPRRKELLKLVVPEFETITSGIDEKLDESLTPEENVINLAYLKAKDVYDRTVGNRIVIGSDTIVTKNGKIYGKPKSKKHAKEMIKELLEGDRTHYVITGLSVIIEKENEYKEFKTFDSTKVYFSDISDEEIDKWIETGHAMDKAAAYGIQNEFGVFIEKIEGNYMSVVGLPINKLYKILKDYI